MKKVLFILNTGMVNAGVPNVIMNIVDNLSNKNLFDILVCDENDRYYDKQFESYGGKIFRTKLLEYENNKIIYPLRGIKLFWEVYKILSKNGKYDIVHCHNGVESGICLLAAKLANIKVRISHSHGIYNRKGKNFILAFYRYLCKILVKKFANVKLTCSQKSGESLFGASNNILNILNPVDISKYHDIQKKTNYKINILQIGYFCNNKNQIFSLNLINKMKEMGLNVNLSLIGFESEYGYLDMMKENIKRMGIEENVTFLKHDYDKKEIFSETDVLLLPSYSEACPLVLLEAQAANIKCIASDNVPEDVNLGLCKFIKLQDEDKWINTIININNIALDINIEKLAKVDKLNYALNIQKIYDGKTKIS